jgi:putative transposase
VTSVHHTPRYKTDLYGCHVVQIKPRETTKECASYGVETAKPIRVREHSCPSCGLECDRELNAAISVLQRGFSSVWVSEKTIQTIKVGC